MEVRKGYKQTEVGVIPEDWDVKTFQSLAHIERGKFTARPRNDPKYYGGDIPFIQTGDVTNSNGQITEYSQTLNQEGLKVSKLFPKGTLFFTIAANIGDVGFATFDTACPDSLVAITPNKNIDKRWLAHELRKRKSTFESIATHNAQLNINLEKLRPYLLPVPPLAEQEAIAEALSDADALIESLETLLAKKRQVKQGAMSELLSGKRRLSGFSGEWEVKSFGELFNISGGLSASRDQLSADGYCYLHYGDIHMSNKTFIDVKNEFQDIPKLNTPLNKVSPASLLNNGDIVFVDASEDDEGASKHVVVINPDGIPYISGLHTIVAKSKTDELNNLYKQYCFQTRAVKNQFRFYSVGTKVTGISKTNIAKITLPVPALAEQTAIAEILSDMDAEIRAVEEKLSKARAVKAGMMSELLTGRVRVV